MPRTKTEMMENILRNTSLSAEELLKLIIKVGYEKGEIVQIVYEQCPDQFEKKANDEFYETWKQEGADSVDISDFEPSHDDSRD